MHSFTQQDLEHNIDDLYLARGLEYARSGRVSGLHRDSSGTLFALVKGTAARPYRVAVRLEKNGRGVDVEGECTCPVGYNCKHVAAALWVSLRDDTPDIERAAATSTPSPTPSPTPSAERPRAAKGMPPVLSLWLDQARRGEAPDGPRETYPAGTLQRLLYLLSIGARDRRVELTLVTARLLKSGGYSLPARWDNLSGALTSQPQFVVAADLRIFRRLQLDAERLVAGGQFALSGISGAEILQAVLETGRCHWQDTRSPALRPAAARAAAIEWEVDDVGAQHLVLRTHPPLSSFLPLAPPHYIDLERRECGVLELGMSPLDAEFLTRIPEVPAAHVEAVREALMARAQGQSLSLPRSIERRDVDTHRITPCLLLDSLLNHFAQRTRYMPLGDVLDVAVLTFDYDGVVVTRDTPGQLTFYRDGHLLGMKRDARAEKAAHAELESLGFQKLTSLTRYCPPEHRHDYGLAGEEAWIHFMAEQLPALRARGWRVEVAEEFRFRIALVTQWTARVEPAGHDWFDLHLEAHIDGQRTDLLPIVLAALRAEPDLLTLLRNDAVPDDKTAILTLDDGRLLPAPVGRLRAILRVLHEMLDEAPREAVRLPRLEAGRLAHLDAAMSLQWQGGEDLRRLGRQLARFDGIAPVAPPPDFGAQLRPYQAEGLAWLQFLRAYGVNGILADDMGLGKTVQALAHILLEKQSGRLDCPALVISPTSVLPNWRAEVRRFAPQLRVHVSHGMDRKASFDQMAGADLVLTTYPLIARDKDVLRKQRFHLVILDEAQLIKNAQTQAARVVGELDARHRLCMSGTPLENNLGELWSLFHFLMPGFLGDAQSFRRLYRTPIEKRGDEARRAGLARRIRPFILRRTKEQVATELPPKSEIVRVVDFEGAQRDLYETVRVSMHERVRAEIRERGLANSHIVVLDALLKLRQICCDPRLLKLDAARKVKESAKLEMLMEMLPELLAEGRRVLLFSQFTSMLALIEQALHEAGIRYVLLTGDTRDREQPVRAFQKGEVSLFLISLKAGGTGLNLTAADTVIHYDPWWNPAVENQATDRAHRIGQDKPVFVYKMIVGGSVEEKITALQKSKAELAASLLDGAQRGGATLTADDIAALFEPMT